MWCGGDAVCLQRTLEVKSQKTPDGEEGQPRRDVVVTPKKNHNQKNDRHEKKETNKQKTKHKEEDDDEFDDQRQRVDIAHETEVRSCERRRRMVRNNHFFRGKEKARGRLGSKGPVSGPEDPFTNHQSLNPNQQS